MNNTEENTNQCTVLPIPRLSEFVDAAKSIIYALKDAGASPGEIISYLKGEQKQPDTPEKIELEVELEVMPSTVKTEYRCDKSPGYPYTARNIARILGLYSMYGYPHAHAVSAILNNNILIDDEHKVERILFATEDLVVYYNLYDEYAFERVQDWVEYHGFPYEVDGYCYTYHVRYGE